MVNSELNTTRSIHYLGSKLRMLAAVKLAIDEVDASNGSVCDLFSGSGTVSKHMLQFRDVIAVDIQQYSKVLCEASMSYLETDINSDDVVTRILEQTTTQHILGSFNSLLLYENSCIEEAMNGNIQNLYEIIESGSLYIYQQNQSENLSNELNNTLNECFQSLKANRLTNSVDSMITRYYGGLYFSYKQAVMMDCIAHFAFEQDGLFKTKILAALLSTASDVVNTVGKQFAQPLKVRDSHGSAKHSLLHKILSDRALDVVEVFRKWLNYYLRAGDVTHNYVAIQSDYVDALKSLKNSGVTVVYADPPYTRYHYSRYYHVLETMCLRDNPEISTTFPNGKGGISRAIYRTERHQSPFCIKSQAEHAFELLFQGVHELNVPLVLSYSPFEPSKAVTPRLQTMDQLLDMAKKYYKNVDVISPGTFTHSKLNSTDKNFEANHEAEMLIVCKNRMV